jgi:hypothetical protein
MLREHRESDNSMEGSHTIVDLEHKLTSIPNFYTSLLIYVDLFQQTGVYTCTEK